MNKAIAKLGAVLRALPVLLVVLFIATPVVFVVITALNEHGIFISRTGFSFSLKWFTSIPEQFVSAFVTSLIIACGAAIVAIPPGVIAGLALARGSFPGKEALSHILLSPLMIPLIVLGVSYYRAYLILWDVTGLSMLETYAGLILAHAGFTWAYVIRTVMAGLTNFSPNVEDAAIDLGASRTYTLLHVTLPIVRPAVIAGAIFAFLMSFDDVPVALFIYGPGTTPLAVELFNYIGQDINPYISAVSALVVLFSIVVMFLVDRLVGIRRFVGLPDR